MKLKPIIIGPEPISKIDFISSLFGIKIPHIYFYKFGKYIQEVLKKGLYNLEKVFFEKNSIIKIVLEKTNTIFI